MSRILSAFLSSALVLSAGTAVAQDEPPSGFPDIGAFNACDTRGEVGPSGTLEPGQSVWIGKGDAEHTPEGRIPFCTSGDWVERHGYEDRNIKFCEVGPDGLDVGSGPFGQYYDTDERKADPQVDICRTQEGMCVKCDVPSV